MTHRQFSVRLYERFRSILERTPLGRLANRVANGLYEKGLDLPREFDVGGFWEEQGSHYMQDQDGLPDFRKRGFRIQEVTLMGYLKKLEFGSVLEVGCGYGRILKLVAGTTAAKIVGVDLSEDQLRNARGYLRNEGIGLSRQRAGDLAFPDSTFDLVFTCNVLLHVPPRDLEKVLKDIIRVSRTHVVLVEPHKGDNKGTRKSYCWDHDYEKQLSEPGLGPFEQQRIQMQETPECGKGFNRIIHVCKVGQRPPVQKQPQPASTERPESL